MVRWFSSCIVCSISIWLNAFVVHSKKVFVSAEAVHFFDTAFGVFIFKGKMLYWKCDLGPRIQSFA